MTHLISPTGHQAIARAIRHIATAEDERPDLAAVAEAAGLSPFYCQRLFTRLAGISPTGFLRSLSVERAKAALQDGATVLDAALEAGVSSPSRLHDAFVRFAAVTPGEYRARGAGLTLQWGLADSPYGPCLLVVSPRGIAALGFPGEEGVEAALASLTRPFAAAQLVEDGAVIAATAARLFAPGTRDAEPVAVHALGSPFQVQVWQALVRIPPGALVSYDMVARAIGQPGAARAVGNAVGANPIAYLIPCHRVIRRTGAFGGYRWGGEVKTALIGVEGAVAA
ncbi:MAG: methylated-DNA--[protein]-cysteine S-methyltransferase [Alphaproteobacteria bacterium]|nr:methylated-DNA--[protein]-cysteine S-methyltransferase [Alphaproteobacteria bacterium]TAD91419.1 MAG: methylated-DNA--[protein]-cysteine S-methyltransferase [Alphaproteobacteria bacterium]